MNPNLSPNTQAILLLTAPLLAGQRETTDELLTPGEYKRLARFLREQQKQPSDLLASEAADLLQDCASVIDPERLKRLLGRGFLLTQAIERWQSRAIWVASRADADYPRRLKTRLKEDAPAVLYGCGDRRLLEGGGLAVVGSRLADDALLEYTQAVGRLCAKACKTLVSGGAKGIDQAAMRGALEADGRTIGVLADSLERTAMNREHRNLVLDGRLVLVSPYDPNAGFNVGNAMQRNKLIYTLADAGLVVNADFKKGGTWAGAVEQLDKLRLVPVYVRSTGEPSEGLQTLAQKGALPWPNPEVVDAFNQVFGPRLLVEATGQEAIAALSDSVPTDLETPKPVGTIQASPVQQNPHPLADQLFAQVREVLTQLLLSPMKEAEIAAALQIAPPQAKAWLQRLVDEGVLEKQKNPAGFVVKQPRLFD